MTKKQKPEQTLETYWFEIDHWAREFRFGINHHPWELSPGHYEGRDTILVFGSLRSKTRRKFTRGELHLLPSYIPREQWGDDADRIGNAWIEDDKLCCSAWLVSDSFYSLTPAIAAMRFKEMALTVKGLRYNRGATDFIDLRCNLTDLDEYE